MPTLREYSQKRMLLKQLQEEVESFENDPNFKSDLEFLEELKALQDRHGKSNSDVMDIINPPAMGKRQTAAVGGSASSSSSSNVGAPARPFPLKVYRNPYTGEEVEAKNLLNKRLQEWCEEHGKEKVREWVVQDENAG